jgi:hypothetical protein
VKNGMSASTLSSWKREFPEVALRLAQAREDCRTRHLDVIEKAAQVDNARGWRAAAWMLERLFPGDYSPRMKERIAHHHFEARQREREDEALSAEKRQAESDARAARAARAAKADQEYQAALAAYEAQQAAAAAEPGVPAAAENHASASEGALHNVKNSSAPGQRPQDGVAVPASCIASESALHNVKNSAEAETQAPLVP